MGNNRTTEAQVQTILLKVMTTGGVFSNRRLKDLVRQELELFPDDLVRSRSRSAEAVYENIINNALSPARSNSLYAQGAVENCGRGLHRITNKGRLLLARQAAMENAFAEVFGTTFEKHDD